MPITSITQNPRRGFTLVELLVVLCILGICGAMTVSSVGSQSDLVVAAASRSVMADLAYAQTRAISLRKKTFIQQSSNQYALLSRDSDSATPTIITNPVTHDPYTTAFQTSGGSLSQVSLAAWNFGGATIFGFDELGSPFTYDASTNTTTSMVSAGSLALSSGASSVIITVQPFSGEMTAE